MKTVCAVCKVLIKDDDRPLPAGLPSNVVSHGLCIPCGEKANADLDAWIEKQEKPVDKPGE